MTNILTRSALRLATRTAIAFTLCSSVHSADAGDPGPYECAMHDLRAINLIEHRAEIPAIRASALFESWSLVIDARAACARGRFEEALAFYDAVDRKLLGPSSVENGEALAELEAE